MKTQTPVKTSPKTASAVLEELEDPSEEIIDPNSSEGRFISAKALSEEQKQRLEIRKLPPFPKKMTFSELSAIWQKLNDDQKSHMVAYLYRLDPVIDRKLVDPKTTVYIDLLSSDEQFSMDYLIATHGGGLYSLIVNDLDTKSTISKFTVEINKNQFDPILNLEELDVWSKKNETYILRLQTQGRLDGERKIIKNPSAKENKDNAVSNSIIEKTFDTLREELRELRRIQANPPTDPAALSIATKFMDMMEARNKAASPEGQISLLGALLPLLQKPEPKDNTLEYLKLMESQKQSYEAKLSELNTKIMDLLAKQAEVKTSPPDLTAEIERIKALSELIGAGGGGGKTSAWERALELLAEPLSAAVPVIGAIIQSKLSGNGSGASSAQTQPINAAGIPRIPMDTQQPTMIEASATGTENGEIGMDIEQQEINDVLLRNGDYLLGVIGNGTTGDTFADSAMALNLMTMIQYNILTAKGSEWCIERMKAYPPFWTKAARLGEERIKQFIDEFVAWGKGDGEEVKEEND